MPEVICPTCGTKLTEHDTAPCRLDDPLLICGACGQLWRDGLTCGQAKNGWPFPTCYPAQAAVPE